MNRQELIDIFCDNAKLPKDYKKLGIFKFAKVFFPNRFDNEFALIHYKVMILFFQLISPFTKYDFERRRYLLIHRQAAKTTFISFLIPIFFIFFKGHTIKIYKSMLTWDFKDLKDLVADEIIEIKISEDFIVIASETASQAENFVMSLKSVIDENNELANIFGEKSPEVIEVDDNNRKRRSKIWRTNAFVTADKTIIYGIGAGQRIRGRNVFGYRPTLLIVDDMYSQYNTKTEETRKKFDYWFKAEALNSVDNKRGKVIWIGTMVHPDTVVKDFRNSDNWIGLEQPIISMNDLQHCIQSCTNEYNQFILPNKEHLKLLRSTVTSLSWEDRHDLYSILVKYKEHLDDNNLNYFYQEYMNEPIAPERLVIKPEHFIPVKFNFYKKDNRQFVEFDYNREKWRGEVKLSAGLDPASSTAKNSDDTVFCIAGYAKCYPITPGYDEQKGYNTYPEGMIFPIIAHIEGGKYAIYDYESLPGMVNAAVKHTKMYNIKTYNIETNSQQIQIAREIRKTFYEKKIMVVVYDEYNSNMSKSDRIMTTLLPIIQYYGKILYNETLKPYIFKLYHQLIALGVTDHDDYPDSLSIAFKNAEVPNYTPSIIKPKSISKNDRWTELYKIYGNDAWYYY